MQVAKGQLFFPDVGRLQVGALLRRYPDGLLFDMNDQV
jgi:hypothetical protein